MNTLSLLRTLIEQALVALPALQQCRFAGRMALRTLEPKGVESPEHRPAKSAAIKLAELYATGMATQEELNAAERTARNAAELADYYSAYWKAYQYCRQTPEEAVRHAATAASTQERALQLADLLEQLAR